nr:hypothetical protein [uncultured Bartonella sp.]
MADFSIHRDNFSFTTYNFMAGFFNFLSFNRPIRPHYMDIFGRIIADTTFPFENRRADVLPAFGCTGRNLYSFRSDTLPDEKPKRPKQIWRTKFKSLFRAIFLQ